MHATYLSLMSLDDKTEELISEIFIERMDRRLDENNWHMHLAAIDKKGEVIPLVKGEDWRGREGMQALISKMPKVKRWDWAINLAFLCVADELNLTRPPGKHDPGLHKAAERRLHNASNYEITEWILREIPQRLAKGFTSMIGTRDVDRYEIHSLARSFCAFANSLNGYGCSTTPFADDTSPYDYRAFDLTHGHEPNVILLTDIHT